MLLIRHVLTFIDTILAILLEYEASVDEIKSQEHRLYCLAIFFSLFTQIIDSNCREFLHSQLTFFIAGLSC